MRRRRRTMVVEPAPCGLLTPHGPHSFGDDDELCPGLPPPPPYTPQHKGVYRPEPGGAWNRLMRVVGKHRAAGDPDLAGPPGPPRDRPRLGWDGETDNDDEKDGNDE